MIYSVILNSVLAGSVKFSEEMRKNVSFSEGWGKKILQKKGASVTRLDAIQCRMIRI